MAIGEEGAPQGVVRVRVAAWVKLGRVWRPVPPITAIRTGSGVVSHGADGFESDFQLRPKSATRIEAYRGMCLLHSPSSCMEGVIFRLLTNLCTNRNVSAR